MPRTGILTPMPSDDRKPSTPNFRIVVMLFAATILAVIIAAAIVVSWRGREATKTPFTKHPLSMLSFPGASSYRV